jgi:hypothetical protein
MEFETYHFTQVLSPKSQVTWDPSVRSQPLRAWKLGLTTSLGVLSPKSQVWHGCPHANTFWRWGSGLVLGVGPRKKLDPTLKHKHHESYLHKVIKIQLFMIINHIFRISWGSKIGTLPPCWDLVTWVGLGTWDLGPLVNCPLHSLGLYPGCCYGSSFFQLSMLMIPTTSPAIQTALYVFIHLFQHCPATNQPHAVK